MQLYITVASTTVHHLPVIRCLCHQHHLNEYCINCRPIIHAAFLAHHIEFSKISLLHKGVCDDPHTWFYVSQLYFSY